MIVSALVLMMAQAALAGGTHTAAMRSVLPVANAAWEQEVNFFALYDLNGNGAVDARELRSVATRADRNAARRATAESGLLSARMTQAFAKLDRNGDGKVSREEFQQANGPT